MTTEAQNALLKILEEPPEDTMFILTTDKVQGVKATIRSRSQQLHITPWSLQAAVKAFQERGYTEAAITTAYHVSGGQPGLLSTLLESPDEHEILQAITLAKSFLKMTAYERLQQVDALSKAKDQTNLLLDGLSRLANNGLRQAASKGSVTQAQQFHKVSTHVQGLQIALSKTANPKLALTHLFLNI